MRRYDRTVEAASKGYRRSMVAGDAARDGLRAHWWRGDAQGRHPIERARSLPLVIQNRGPGLCPVARVDNFRVALRPADTCRKRGSARRRPQSRSSLGPRRVDRRVSTRAPTARLFESEREGRESSRERPSESRLGRAARAAQQQATRAIRTARENPLIRYPLLTYLTSTPSTIPSPPQDTH